MAKTCIFCGKELGMFGSKRMLCGNVEQTVCPQCHELMSELSQQERGQRALDTGRAENPQGILAYLNRMKEEEQRQERARQSLRTGDKCLRCGGPMERYGRKTFHLGEEGLFGPVARDGLFAAWLEADILRCAQCGWAEFYLPQPPEIPEGSPVEEQTVTCPVCGGKHSPLISCPWCAARDAGGARSAKARTEPEEGERASRKAEQASRKPWNKPPWEK